MRRCTKCLCTKPLEEFRIKRGYYYPRCRDCEKEDGREYRRRLNRRLLIAPIFQKTCCDCDRLLPISEFRTCRFNKDGYQTICRECSTIRTRNSIRRLQITDPVRLGLTRMLHNAKSRSKKAGTPCDLTLDWLFEQFETQRYCPILGYELSWCPYSDTTSRGDRSYVASIDRIDSALGYTKDNVWVICELANRMKTDAPLDALRRFAAYYAKA